MVARVAGGVLIGGASRRMGRPKHRLVVGGRELARTVAEALGGAGCDPVWQVGGDDPVPGVPALADRWPGEGPLGGVLTVLDAAAATSPDIAAVVVAACDLPGLDSATVAGLVHHRASSGAGAVGAVADGDLVALARWHVDRRHELTAAFEAGLRSWRGGLEVVGAEMVAVPSTTTVDLDTPADLARWSASVIGVSIPEIDVDALAAALESGDVRLIDVREPDEYEAGHVPGAELIPLGTVADHLDRFTGPGPTYVICRSGGRSMRACEFVAEQGDSQVVNIAGGTLAWVESGRPTASGSS